MKYFGKVQVKQTRTNEMVEEKGKLYERSVHEFDTQAAKVASFPEKMPDDKENHQKEILEVSDPEIYLFISAFKSINDFSFVISINLQEKKMKLRMASRIL